MDEAKVSPSKQPQHGNTTPTMQRRYSFSRQATEAIEKGKQKSSPRKASSLSSMHVDNASPNYWSDCHAEQEESVLEQAMSAPKVEVVPQPTSQSDDVSLMLDINGSSDRFSDDDSDGSSYSSVCSNEECSPTPSSTGSVTSSSPLLSREPSAVGFKTLHSEASEPSSLNSISCQDSPHEDEVSGEVPPMPMFSFELSPKYSSSLKLNDKPQEANVEANDDDLPDWLLERVVLTPAASTTKTSMRSPKQIEDEIRFAVDSAAARVQQELGRREQFHSELQSAAAFSVTPTTTDSQPAASKLFSSRENDPEGPHVQERDDPFSGRCELEMEAITEQDIITNEGGQRNLLLLMEVVIGDGRTETIEIHDGDNPDALALAFAQKHMLQPDAIPKLRGLIQEQINAAGEAEPEETMQAEQTIADEWTIDAEFDHYVSSAYTSTSTPAPITTNTCHAVDYMNSPSTAQPEHTRAPQQVHERENNREFKYNNLIARYGHYSQHSGKVDPEGSRARRYISSDTPASHSAQVMSFTGANGRVSTSSTAPAFTTTINNSRSSSSKKKNNLADAPAYERLHALAESKNKWIQRAQKAKEIELARDQEKMLHVELMAAKSRELVANRTNGGYAHIGERLHDEALSDMAKKVQRHELRVLERERQQDWMCPKCAYVNQYNDSRCQNIVALAEQKLKAHRGKSANSGRHDTASSVNSSFRLLVSHPDILCGQPKPERLFQPTLLTSSGKVVSGNQGKSSRVSSLRRQRHQNAVEKEFKQTYPFKPKINIVSEEIVREKLETATAAAAVHGETRRPRNPHLELYENSFQARAQREEREEEYFKQFPFKPDIGVNALWVSPDKSQSDFVERLAVDKYHELERKRVALHDKYAPDRDPQSGKELFKPEIGRAPAFARNKQGLPIGDFLHAAHREQQEYHRQLREKDQREIKKKSQQTFVSEASRQALERRKADTCKRIFNHLLVLSHQPASTVPEAGTSSTTELSKPGEDGIGQQEESIELAIPTRVNLSVLPAEISRVVAIVFEYANHTPISRDAFCGYMDRLVREVPGITYSQIIFLAEHLEQDRGGRYRNQDADSEREAALLAAEEKELTFHPAIDKNSREIAMKHGRVSGSKVFNALNQYYDHYLERKEQLRKQQQREFKKSHPFQPTLITKAYQRDPAATAFYDKILMGNFDDSGNTASWKASASVSSAHVGGAQPPPAPLQTAISNARPFVRPIESEHSRFYTAGMFDGPLLDDGAGSLSRSSSSSQLLEDADLTSRVLAALDEKPTTASPTSYHLKALTLSDDASVGSKVCSVRSPEGSTLTEPPLF